MNDPDQYRDVEVSQTSDNNREARSWSLARRSRRDGHTSRDPAHDLGDDQRLAELGLLEERDDYATRRLLFRTLAMVRQKLGITQAEIARKMGTTQSAVSDIEKGQSDPRLSTVQRMSRAMGMELRVHLANRWVAIFSWHDRAVGYGTSSVLPMSEANGDSVGLWIVGLFDDHDPDRAPNIFSHCYIQPEEVGPVEARTGEDEFLTGPDVRQLSLAHAASGID